LLREKYMDDMPAFQCSRTCMRRWEVAKVKRS
jgi:hypothetical protein